MRTNCLLRHDGVSSKLDILLHNCRSLQRESFSPSFDKSIAKNSTVYLHLLKNNNEFLKF